MGGQDHDARPALPSTPPDGSHSGTDDSDLVRVELDGAARDVTVVLEDGWREGVGTAGLPAAVLQAFSAATTARLIAWATATATATATAIAQYPSPSHPPANRPAAEALSRAWRDLGEFRLRLATLHETTETASSPGGLAVVTVAGGQLVALRLDQDRLPTATSRDLERHIGHALRGALARISAVPERALEGCPDLSALLAHTSFSAI